MLAVFFFFWKGGILTTTWTVDSDCGPLFFHLVVIQLFQDFLHSLLVILVGDCDVNESCGADRKKMKYIFGS